MAIGIDDLDDLEEDFTPQPNPQEPPAGEPNDDDVNHQEEGDAISDFLRTRGIDDINSINFQEDDGSIITRSWKDLSREEQFNILSTPLEQEDPQGPELSNEEVELLNTIRNSNMSPAEYIESIKGGEVVQEPQYKIDDLSDDEVYLLDLETRVGELTDEEAAQALNIAKQNEEFYKKQIEGIRKDYKAREDFQKEQEQATLDAEQQEAFNTYKTAIVDSINGFNSIGNLDLDLDDNDKEELAAFILSQDEAGRNYLWQALQDPGVLTKAAWFILNGEDAFDNISEYFANQIKLVSEAQYKKGFEEAKKGIKPNPTVVIDNSNHKTYRPIKSIDELDD